MATAKKSPAKQKTISASKNTKSATKNSVAVESEEFEIPLSKLRFDPNQPRTDIRLPDGRLTKEAEAKVKSLALSIKSSGQISTITARPDPDRKGGFMVVVGENRTLACLELGLKSVRGKVRYDLEDPGKRLIVQLAENVDRDPLSDADTAKSIYRLLKGDESTGIKPLDKISIAEQLGKSPSWVTRYLNFGDTENRRVWVDTGIVDSVEKLYRLTLLPKPIQIEILKRCELDATDPRSLAKPLSRTMIDDIYASHRKGQQRGGTGGVSGIEASVLRETIIGRAQEGIGMKTASLLKPGEGYRISPEDRARVLGGNYSSQYNLDKEAQRPTMIFCATTMANAVRILQEVGDSTEILKLYEDAKVEFKIPNKAAQYLASKLTGMEVGEDDLDRKLQFALSKLK